MARSRRPRADDRARRRQFHRHAGSIAAIGGAGAMSGFEARKARARASEPTLITFGCRLNAYESEVIRAHAKNAGLTDTIIVNTCAVTAEAERQARKAIRKARRERPTARIIVTGCAAQIDPAKFAAMAEVDQVLGNEEKLRPESFLPNDGPRVRVNDISSVSETAGHLIEGFEGRARAFVQVQQGCDHRCTFCIIPFGRGNSRSVPMGEVVAQTRKLVQRGYREVVLSGVDITAYGADLPGQPTLGQMARRLLAAVPELKRLRLSSLDPAEVDDDLLELIATEERLMPHLHLSLQSGDDMILKRMKRRHSRAQAIAFCRAVRALRPGIVFGADLIAGFPTETEEMFENTHDLIAASGLTYLHVFPFSARPGTPAAAMPQVRPEIRKRRAARLRACGEDALDRFLISRIGATAEVLVESPGTGRSEHYAPVSLDPAIAMGSIVKAVITGVKGGRLIARQVP
ncbi:MAG: tRNA (N(6)-L-threonylcarbamoyladenosine(37)-C(2))-methylthiotransferase MtaB [Proteobacteria bacterium]|nr:tRNA (N(6)-L-threonylcarbamoyladenosine(37)-C(2))-methylthiotransferase MtaB [Pseudomonadota bacterium]